MSQAVREAIERLTVERGEKKGSFWCATFSVKDVLEKTQTPNTEGNQRYVSHIVRRFYPGSRILPGQGDNGGFLELKIRSI